MNELLQALDDILKSQFKMETQSGICILEEPGEPDYPLIKIKKTGKTLLYRFPHNVEQGIDIFPLFDRKMADLTKICDYVIFYPYKQGDKTTFFVFLCELKTNNTNGAIKQVQATKILANYLIEMAQRYLNFKTFQVEYRALIFSTTNIPKLSTKIKPDYEVSSSGLKFKHLKTGEDCQLNHHCY